MKQAPSVSAPSPSSGRQDTAAPRKHDPRYLRPWVFWLIVIATLSPILALLFYPIHHRPGPKAAARTQAIRHLKQLNLALIDFEADYGRYPDASTIAAVRAATGTALDLGTESSNDFFRQLMAAGETREQIFWLSSGDHPQPPDGILGENALAPGECSFTYIPGLSASADPLTPVAMNPVRPGTLTFDPGPFEGKAVILRIDGSVTPETIRPDGRVTLKGRMNLFDPGQPWWNGKAPDVKWPD